MELKRDGERNLIQVNRKNVTVILSVFIFQIFHESTDEVHIRQRSILWYLVFIGFSVNYMIRINVNIAIVDMLSGATNIKKSSTINSSASECFVRNFTQDGNSTETSKIDEDRKFPSFERKILDSLGVSLSKNGIFELINSLIFTNCRMLD